MADGPGFIDLDAVSASSITVKVNDVEYLLPGDAPSEIIVNLLRCFGDIDKLNANDVETDEEIDKMVELRSEVNRHVRELFEIENDLEPGELNLTEDQIGNLVRGLFNHYYGGDDDDGRPTPAKTRAKRKSSPRSRGASKAATRRKASASSTSSTT